MNEELGERARDIKPYVRAFDLRETEEIGWLKGRAAKVVHTKSDGRLK